MVRWGLARAGVGERASLYTISPQERVRADMREPRRLRRFEVDPSAAHLVSYQQQAIINPKGGGLLELRHLHASRHLTRLSSKLVAVTQQRSSVVYRA